MFTYCRTPPHPRIVMTPLAPSPRRAATAALCSALLLFAVVLIACPPTPKDSPDPAAPATTSNAASPSAATTSPPGTPAEEAEAAAVSAALKAVDLKPAILARGGDRLPADILIEFARTIAADSQVGGPVIDGTVLTIDPPTVGELRYSSPSTLEFVPSEPLLPDTAYTVVLSAIATPHATLSAPPGDAAWTRTFTTPGFRVLRADWRNVSASESRAAIDVVFSGSIDVATYRYNGESK